MAHGSDEGGELILKYFAAARFLRLKVLQIVVCFHLLGVLIRLKDRVSKGATDHDESADDRTDAKAPERHLCVHYLCCDERGKASSNAQSQDAERLQVLLALFVAARLLDYQGVHSRIEKGLSDGINKDQCDDFFLTLNGLNSEQANTKRRK